MQNQEARYGEGEFVRPEDGEAGGWWVKGWKNGFPARASSAQEAYLKVEGRIVNPSTAGVEWLGAELAEGVDLGSMR